MYSTDARGQHPSQFLRARCVPVFQDGGLFSPYAALLVSNSTEAALPQSHDWKNSVIDPSIGTAIILRE
jgi:hypothetical protein